MIKLFNIVVCAFIGHGDVEKHLEETKEYIATTRCSRCKCKLMGGYRWKFNIPPPNSTPAQIINYENYYENELQKLRDTVI